MNKTHKVLIVPILMLSILCFGIQLFAQDTITDWGNVSDPREEVDFQMPSKSFEVFSPPSDIRFESRQYSSILENNTYTVFSGIDKNQRLFELILKFAVQNNGRCQKYVTSETVYECEFKEFGFSHKFKTIVTDRRAYTFYCHSKGKADIGIDRFFGSIKKVRELKPEVNFDKELFANVFDDLVKPAPVAEASEVLPTDENTANNLAITEDEPQNPMGGSETPSSGGGLGSGAPEVAERVPEFTPKGKSEPFKIHSSPRPGYTELARIFNIVGIVRLVVTFNAIGEIGLITVSEPAPFGLTDNAITVAKAIRFRPELLNGKPISIRKNVVYNFTIY